MALFFITGSPGAGKSELTRVLRNHGYEAYDTDDDALARWQNKITGYIYPKSSVTSEQRTPEFLAQHAWNVPREYVEELAKKAQGKPIFLLGVANNELELHDLFGRVFALHIDNDTLVRRLKGRTDNDWGKQPHELRQSLGINEAARDRYLRQGYTVIDAMQPAEDIAAEITAEIL